MVQLTYFNLIENLKSFMNLFDSDFITSVDNFDTTGLKWMESHRAQSSAHPLALWIRNYKNDSKLSIENKQITVSDTTLRLLRLFNDLQVIKVAKNYDRIMKAIMEKDTFYSSVFEAYIASEYISKGYKIEVVEEKAKDKVRTCDLRAKVGEKVINIECKSLDDKSIKHSRLFDQLLSRLSKIIQKYKRSWEVKIYCSRQINGKDMENVLAGISNRLKNNVLDNLIIDVNYSVQFKRLWDWDHEILGELRINGMSEISSVGMATMITSIGLQKSKNIFAINIYDSIDTNVSTRLEKEYKKANGQLPKSGDNIIHIELPFKKGVNLLNAIDSSYNRIYSKLNRNSSRVNAIILSGAIIDRENENPILYNHYMVPNFNSKTSLPEMFSILGANDKGVELPEDGGVMISFQPKDKALKIPSIVYDHCSKHGRSQLRIWFTWKNAIRIDLLTEKLHRRVVETTEYHLKANEMNEFIGNWNENNLEMKLNGKLLTKT